MKMGSIFIFLQRWLVDASVCGEVLFVFITFDMSFSCYLHGHVPGAKVLLVWSGIARASKHPWYKHVHEVSEC